MTKLQNLLAILFLLQGAAFIKGWKATNHFYKDDVYLLEFMNDERRVWAIESEIPNMNMLEYSNELAEHIKAIPHNTTDCIDTYLLVPSSTRYFFFSSNNDTLRWHDAMVTLMWNNGTEEVIKHVNQPGLFYELELAHPLITKIGCHPYRCSVASHLDGEKIQLEYDRMCLVDSEKMFDWKEPKGVPGTGCGSGDFNVAGLCKKAQPVNQGTHLP